MALPFEWTQDLAIKAVRNTIGDPDGAATERWTDAEIANYLDRAGQTVILDTQLVLRTEWEFLLVADQDEYTMAENFVEAYAVKWWKSDDESDQKKLEFIPFDEWNRVFERDPVASGSPAYYTIWNRMKNDLTTIGQPPVMFIRPVPSTEAEGATDKVHVWGVKTPDLMDVGDSYAKHMEFKGHHMEALISWASSLAFWDDDEAGKAQAMEGRYQRLVEKIKNDEARRDRSSRPMARPRRSRLLGMSPALPQDFWQRWGRP
jgi:hypothetical protein